MSIFCTTKFSFSLPPRSSLKFLFITGFLWWWACLNPFAPAIENSPDLQFLVTEQRSPEEVLKNFKLAYFFRDSVLYYDCLDSAFIFYFFDPNFEGNGRYVNWGKELDLRTTGRLFRNFEVINLVWESTIYQDTLTWNASLQPAKIELITQFSLKLGQFNSGFDFDIWGKAIFTFILNNYDKKWRIIRWEDKSNY